MKRIMIIIVLVASTVTAIFPSISCTQKLEPVAVGIMQGESAVALIYIAKD